MLLSKNKVAGGWGIKTLGGEGVRMGGCKQLTHLHILYYTGNLSMKHLRENDVGGRCQKSLKSFMVAVLSI